MASRSSISPPRTARRSTSTAPRRSRRGTGPSTRPSPSYPHAIHYALKANSTLAIARLLRSLGSNADANSGGEIDVALRAGFIPPQIVFTGVGKTSAELSQAIELGVRTINVESAGEIERIDALSSERQTRTRIAIRVNPDIDARSHPHISTGLKTQQVRHPDRRRRGAGAPRPRSRGRRDRRPAQPRRIADPRPRSAAPGGGGAGGSRRAPLRHDGIAIEHLDLGGGLGVSYDGIAGAVGAGLCRRRSSRRSATQACRSFSSRAATSSRRRARC